MDIVAYSKLPADQEPVVLNELQQVVSKTATVQRARANDTLISLPTGDGMALVFFGSPELPVKCALEIGRALQQHPAIKLRMGIHTGPVFRVADINANRNVAGGGINMAQRVMDCGDAGHILVSKVVADVLSQVSTWSNVVLSDLGEVEVKHQVRVHIVNLHTDFAGNKELPKKVAAARRLAATHARGKWMVAVAVMVALIAGGFWYSQRPHPPATTDALTLTAHADNSDVTLIGSIMPPPKKGEVVKIMVEGQKSMTSPDDWGRFKLPLNGKAGDRIRLQVYVNGKMTYDDFQVLPGPVTLSLFKPN